MKNYLKPSHRIQLTVLLNKNIQCIDHLWGRSTAFISFSRKLFFDAINEFLERKQSEKQQKEEEKKSGV